MAKVNQQLHQSLRHPLARLTFLPCVLQVHQNVLPIREGKQGWIHHFAPDGICFHDNAKVFADIVSNSLLLLYLQEVK